MSGDAMITCVMPAYNAEAFLARTLDSLIAQSQRCWSAVIVDDGSTDGTLEIARAYAARDARLMVVSKANGGVSSARNAALGEAHAPYVAFLDSDDLLEPDAFEVLYGVASAAPGGAALGGYRVVDGEDRPVRTYRPGAAEIDVRSLAGAPIWTGAQLIPRAAIGGLRFDESLVGYEDLDLWHRLAERGLVWRCTDRVVASYRIRAQSLTKRFGEMVGSHARVVAGIEGRRALASGGGSWGVRDHAGVVMSYAMGAAIAGLDVSAGVSLIDAHGAGLAFDAAATGVSAVHSVVHVAARGLRRPVGGDPAAAVCAGLWREMETRGWAARGFADDAWRSLCTELIEPDEVARAMLDDAPGDAEIVLLGYGRNGRALARLAHETDRRVEVRDDAFDAGSSARPAGVATASMASPLPAGAWVVSSPLRDEGIIARLGGRVNARWREAVGRLAGDPMIG